MVQGTKGRTLMLLTVSAMLFSVSASAQHHDKEKYRQIRSMETGPWDFSPGEYYYFGHKKYSGAEWKWKFGIPPYKIKYKESKSNVGTVGPTRAAQIPVEIISKNHVDDEIEAIDPLLKEEVLLIGERSVDLVYGQYKDIFQDLGESIQESLLYAQEHAKGKLDKTLAELQEEYDVICASIDYAHQTGLTNQIEPTKRQLLYEDAKMRLTELSGACFKIAQLAATY